MIINSIHDILAKKFSISLFSKQIQKEAALPEMEALQKELSSQAAGQAPLENPVKDGQAD